MAQGRKEALSVQALQLLDAFLIWLSFWLAGILRDPVRELLGMVPMEGTGLRELPTLLFVIIPAAPITLEWFGYYRRPLRKKIGDSLVQLFQALVIVGFLVGALVIALRIPVESRLILGSAVPIGVVLLLLREGLVRTVVFHSVREEDAKEAVIYVGSEESLDEFDAGLSVDVRAEFKVVARFRPSEGTVDEFRDLLKQESVGRVIFAARHTEFGILADLVEACELQGVEAWISADFIQTQVARPDFDILGGKPMLVLRSTPDLSWALWVKEVIDRVGALVIIVTTGVFWIVAAIGIKIASPRGPVFFRQKRAGRYGKPFWMWKFRTMAPDAEAKLAEVKEEGGNEMSGPVFKLQKDPRVFPFGRFLRKFSIDEFPQFINVLKGDMSLVGPRPLPLYEVEQFEKSEHRRRLSMKPGITCIWQAGGRNKITSFEDWVAMDLEYIDNWSLWLDLKLLLKTVPAVLFGWGAK
ncbi:MAG: sugar transferase [Verrucomicrobia bacterium]|nr:sugar transferase [Verrucomicrobiota bacterium]